MKSTMVDNDAYKSASTDDKFGGGWIVSDSTRDMASLRFVGRNR